MRRFIKRLSLFKCLAAIGVLMAASSAVSAQAFKKGDVVADLNVGVGVAHTTELKNRKEDDKTSHSDEDVTKLLLTQRLGIEFGIADIGEKSALGLGFAINNACGNTSVMASGSYNYEYSYTVYRRENKKWAMYEQGNKRRVGMGTAKATATIEDLSLTLRLALHHQFVDNLDTYVGIGGGISRIQFIYSDFTDTEGFHKMNESFDSQDTWHLYQTSQNYDDLAHVKWDSSAISARFAASAFVGARYYLNSHWGLNLEAGLPVVTFKKDYNNYTIATIGVSYKF